MMPKKIKREAPLPIPLSVICSPSHITTIAPVVRVTIVMNTKVNPGVRTASGTDVASHIEIRGVEIRLVETGIFDAAF